MRITAPLKPKHRRMVYVATLLLVIGVAVGLVLDAFSDNMQFFTSPSELVQNPPPPGRQLRLGGMVVSGSIQRDPQSLRVDFRLTDYAHEIAVTYTGALPDLFKEDSGAVVIGNLGTDGVFQAQTLMARHDENYMPPEVAAALQNKPAIKP
jgi:cytochrome c-type biogenesis protein CcmE